MDSKFSWFRSEEITVVELTMGGVGLTFGCGGSGGSGGGRDGRGGKVDSEARLGEEEESIAAAIS